MAKDKIDHLTEIVKRGFADVAIRLDDVDARMERGFGAIADDIADLRTELKADIFRVAEQLTSIEGELREIKRRLDLLEEAVGGMKGFSKEIDDVRDRVRAIEKHLGIQKKIAA